MVNQTNHVRKSRRQPPQIANGEGEVDGQTLHRQAEVVGTES